ncbi:DUF4214 domain-containing protein [Archangium violaceum]|uniref:DUF4214 domain-containing protein n=1 Tax=Archangium violaceum TaxID=83451 RepID=UPI001951A9F5|nr:DUF4214 domain-containing protein [Archangium violaceum]QRN99638.1 DUF4214 domain-containing protein [Archangium violaceum]
MHLKTWSSWLISLGLTGSTAALAADSERAALAGVEAQVRALGGEKSVEADLLEIKFHDNQLIRLRNGAPTDLAGRGLRTSQASVLLKAVEGGRWMRSHDASEEALETLQAEGEKRTAEPQPDLNLYFRVRLPVGLDANRIAAAFLQLPEVEAVYRVPVPVEPPTAPDYYSVSTGSYQKYQDAAPAGIDGRYADTVAGARGTNVKICDVEYSFNGAHADLGTVTAVGPAGVDPFNNTNHGTAVAGVYGSLSNGEGTTGIAYNAQKLFAYANTASGYNVGAAVTTCAANINAGDVILIEQQISGPNGTGKYVPPEWYKPWYDAIKAAVAANKIVVETAGNGSQNLDDAIYSTGNNGHYPFLAANDSGAILVGAGKSPAWGSTARTPHDYSTYGSTVDLQGWGDSVTTTGYGDLYSTEGVNRWYTATFSGTSSSAPVVTGAVASIQGAARASGRGVLTPSTVLNLLSGTGTPQGSDPRHIGPLPDLRQALTTNPIDRSEFFVRQTYLDVLKREPDAGGLANNVSILQSCNGNATCLASNRVAIARNILESPENRQQDPDLNPASSGYNSAFVTHCYTNFLRRQPSASEVSFWLNILNTGGDYSAVVNGFITSTEYRQRFGMQ